MFTKLMLTWLLIETHVISAAEHMFNTAQVPPDGSRQRTHGSPALSYISRLQGFMHSSAKHACFVFFHCSVQAWRASAQLAALLMSRENTPLTPVATATAITMRKTELSVSP